MLVCEMSSASGGPTRRQVGVVRDFRSTSLLFTFNRRGRIASRERHHCASADVVASGRSAAVAASASFRASWPLKTKLRVPTGCFLVSAGGRLSPIGDTSFSSEPPSGHVVPGNRLDARKTLRRRSVTLDRDRRRAARHHALLGGGWRQWTRADNTLQCDRKN